MALMLFIQESETAPFKELLANSMFVVPRCGIVTVDYSDGPLHFPTSIQTDKMFRLYRGSLRSAQDTRVSMSFDNGSTDRVVLPLPDGELNSYLQWLRTNIAISAQSAGKSELPAPKPKYGIINVPMPDIDLPKTEIYRDNEKLATVSNIGPDGDYIYWLNTKAITFTPPPDPQPRLEFSGYLPMENVNKGLFCKQCGTKLYSPRLSGLCAKCLDRVVASGKLPLPADTGHELIEINPKRVFQFDD